MPLERQAFSPWLSASRILGRGFFEEIQLFCAFMPVQLVTLKAVFAIGYCHLRGQVRFSVVPPRLLRKALLGMSHPDIPENVIWPRGGGLALNGTSRLVRRKESQWREGGQALCPLPPSWSKRKPRIKELHIKAVPRFPSSPNTFLQDRGIWFLGNQLPGPI